MVTVIIMCAVILGVIVCCFVAWLIYLFFINNQGEIIENLENHKRDLESTIKHQKDDLVILQYENFKLMNSYKRLEDLYKKSITFNSKSTRVKKR